MANVKTRNIATDNVVKVAQRKLIDYVKAACPDTLCGIEKAAFTAGNRQTIQHVSYTACYDYQEGNVWLIPETVSWTYQVDALTQAEKIELANMRKLIEPINMLVTLGNISEGDAIEMRNALVDAERFYQLEIAEHSTNEQYVSAFVASECDYDYVRMVNAMEHVTGIAYESDKSEIHIC